VLIAAVWVNPQAADAKAVFANNRAAMRHALLAGVNGGSEVGDMLAAREDPWNPFYRPR
jgi:5,6,7,8-tetrahydromethanopterin hydro-lyase